MSFGIDALAPKSALPLGATRKVDESKATKIEPTSSNLLYAILAVSWAATEEQLSDANVAGFIYVYRDFSLRAAPASRWSPPL